MGRQGTVDHCGICGSDSLEPFLWLGVQPLAEAMETPSVPKIPGHLYPLALLRCNECSLVQLDFIPPQDEVFRPDHPYATGNTRVMRDHYSREAVFVELMCQPGDLVVDIGANDGTFLNFLRPDLVRLAVEPTNKAQVCLDKGLLATQAFFTRQLAGTIVADCGLAKVVTASNVLAHVPDPHDFMAGVAALLADDGVFITSNHDVRAVTAGLQIDTVYHEHLRYYSIASLSRLLSMHGLEIVNVQRTPIHGGSFQVTAMKDQGALLQRRANHAVAELHTLVAGLHDEGNTIVGVSAATRASTLLNAAGLAPFLDYVAEVPGSEKIGKWMPGTTVPVMAEQRMIDEQPHYALLFCWHIADDVIPKLKAAGYEGRFIVPLPEPRIV